MVMKRTSLHLEDRDLKALERLAKAESKRTGSTISASQIVRRLIREHLQQKQKPTPDAVRGNPPARSAVRGPRRR